VGQPPRRSRRATGDADLPRDVAILGLENVLDAEAGARGPDAAALRSWSAARPRARQDWAEADRLRDELAGQGWQCAIGRRGRARARIEPESPRPGRGHTRRGGRRGVDGVPGRTVLYGRQRGARALRPGGGRSPSVGHDRSGPRAVAGGRGRRVADAAADAERAGTDAHQGISALAGPIPTRRGRSARRELR